MNGGQPQFTPRKRTMFNDYRLPHPSTTEPLQGAKYPATLLWEEKNNGSFVLKVNDGIWKEGAKNTHKEVEMDAYSRGLVFETVLEACSNPEFATKQVVIRKHQFVFTGGSGRLSDSPIVQVTLTIGRNTEGVISIGYSKGDYKVMFIFKPPFHSAILTRQPGADQPTEDVGLGSRLSARAWVNFHRHLIDRLEYDVFQPPKPRNQNNNSGGGFGGGGNAQSNKSSAPDFDDDFDF